MAITCRCTGKVRCTRAKAWNWNVLPWPIGSVDPLSSSRRWLRHYEITSYRQRHSMLTIPRCRCYNPAKVRLRLGDCGRTSEMREQLAVPTRRRCGLLIRRIVRASIPYLICKTLVAYCKPMATRVMLRRNLCCCRRRHRLESRCQRRCEAHIREHLIQALQPLQKLHQRGQRCRLPAGLGWWTHGIEARQRLGLHLEVDFGVHVGRIQ